MHSALLPVHEQFTPKGHASRQQEPFLRRSRATLRRQQPALWLRRALVVLLVMFVAVRFVVVPRRIAAATAAAAAVQSASASQGDGQLIAPDAYYYSLADQSASTSDAGLREERLLICMPLRNAEPVLDLMFDHLRNLTYPHALIDIAFLVSDSVDATYTALVKESERIQAGESGPNGEAGWNETERFGSIDIYARDFGARISQDVDERHGVAVQAERRKLMGRARNWLLSLALRPQHSWVYWRDADIERSPPSIIEDLMRFDKDVIVPNVWRPLPTWLSESRQQPYDLNSWQESDAALDLARQLDENDVIVEGYAEYPTWRVHLAYLRNDDGSGDLNDIIDLDGVGGVSILVKAKVFRAGSNFPGYAFLSHAETEGFGKMCRRMGFSVAGLTQYTVWHKYEPSEDDLATMRERESLGLPID